MYIPHTKTDKEEMLKAIGAASFEELVKQVPAKFLWPKINLPGESLDEAQSAAHMAGLAARNCRPLSFLGAGAYERYTPAAVKAITSRTEFLTAYTPYQPEASQGTLQAIYEFQSLICEITGNEAANASLYDGATALAEAVIMARSIKKKGTRCLVPASLNPFCRQVLDTYVKGLGIEIATLAFRPDGTLDLSALTAALSDEVFGVVVQSPNFFGVVEDMAAVAALKSKSPFCLIAMPDLLSLALLEAPGKIGADICAGEAHYFASGTGFGGPLLGFLATHKDNLRQMPGRIVGKTVDKDGKRGFVLTAQTREQHIRREKATSNICSNQALCAIRTAIYLSAVGKTGLQQVANLNLQKAHYAADQISKIPGFKLAFGGAYFNEFVIECPKNPEQINKKLLKNNIIGGLALKRFYPKLKNSMLLCVTEMTTRQEIDNLVNILSKV